MLAAADACDRVASAGSVAEQRAADYAAAGHMEAIQVGLTLAELQRHSVSPHRRQCLPVRCEGEDIGRVESRIPKRVFFHLLKQKNFGFEGLASDEGQRDLRRQWPQFAVETVSGRPTVGYRRRAARRWHFGPGTLDLRA